MIRKTKHFVQAIEKGFLVLQAFTADRPALTLSQIAALTGMNAPTTQRITDTLLDLGYLKRNSVKQFFLGPKVLTLGFSFLNGSQLRTLAQRYIDEFFERYQMTVNLTVLEGGHILYLCRREGRRFLKYDIQPGFRLPAHCAAMGKVMIAGLPDNEMAAVIESIDFERMTRFTIVDPVQFRQNVLKVREQGYAVCDRELSLEVTSIAFPVLEAAGRVVAAVNVSIPSDKARSDFLMDAINKVKNLGRDLSESLGYHGPYPLIRPIETAAQSRSQPRNPFAGDIS